MIEFLGMSTHGATKLPEPDQLLGMNEFQSNAASDRLGNPVKVHQERVEVITRGRGWAKDLKGELRVVEVGDIIWHMPGDWTICRTDPEAPYGCINIVFRSHGAVEGGPRRVRRFARWGDVEALHRFVNQVIGLHEDRDFDRDVLRGYVFNRLLFEVKVSARREVRQALPLPLQQALQVIQTRLSEPLKMKDLSAAVGWSIPHLHDAFRVHLGTSPHQELIRLRLLAARRMLAGSDESVKYIAAECGFGSGAAFCQVFRKHIGRTPLEFREFARRM